MNSKHLILQVLFLGWILKNFLLKLFCFIKNQSPTAWSATRKCSASHVTNARKASCQTHRRSTLTTKATIKVIFNSLILFQKNYIFKIQNKNSKDCFSCKCCSHNFADEAAKNGGKLDPNKIYKDDKSQLYCEPCYGKNFCKACEKCSKPILPKQPGLLFDDKNYHKECFSCDCCSHKINADTDKIKSDNKKYFKHENGKVLPVLFWFYFSKLISSYKLKLNLKIIKNLFRHLNS